MSIAELSSMTVLELRILAREKGVKLSAGISKAGIVERLAEALTAQTNSAVATEEAQTAEEAAPEAATSEEDEAMQEDTAQVENADDSPEVETEKASAAETKPAAQQPQFRQAWRAPSAPPRYNARPAYQAPAYPQRQAWQNRSAAPRPTPANDAPRYQQTVRPSTFTPRFGPDAQDPVTPGRGRDEYRVYRQEPTRMPYGQERPMQDMRLFDNQQRSSYEQQRSFEAEARSYDQPRNSYDGGYVSRPAYGAPRQNMDPGLPSPAVAEMLAAGDCPEGSGVLEMHPDGYGFLRSATFMPSSKDIYVSMAQIRRFGLRTGDFVTGKTRPQRDGDKYAAMLYITTVNGQPADDACNRPGFDELTPIYPNRRIDLDCHEGEKLDDMRMADLMAPLGFGQRALILCPPDTGKEKLLEDFAKVIHRNHQSTTVMVLLIDENPEDVTLFREAVDCQVLASTFDQPPESHLRLTDLVLERAQRLVEQKQDVVLIVDSLTRLAKTYTTTAAQQGRSVPGMVNPTSLFRAKKLFGAARCMKEGGSLTIIAAMDVETGMKVDDTIVEEFRGTANMQLVLDAAVAKAGVRPPFNLPQCYTKHAEQLLTKEQLEGVALTRQILGTTHSATAIPQLLSMMDKVDSNVTFLSRVKDWAALMNKGR